MDSRVFEYVVSLARTHSFTRSAKELYITTQGLSAAVRRLEAKLGVPLFDIDGHSVNLTEYGQLFHRYALEFLEKNTDLEAELDLLVKKNAGRLNVALSFGLSNIISRSDILAFNEKVDDGPRITMLRSMLENDCVALLEGGSFDFALMCTPSSDVFATVPIFRDYMFLWVPEDSEPARRGSATIQDTQDRPLVCLAPSEYTLMRTVSQKDDFAELTIYADDHIELLREATRRNAYGMTGRCHVEALAHPGYVGVPLTDTVWGFDLCWLKDRNLTDHDRAFIDHMKGLAQFHC